MQQIDVSDEAEKLVAEQAVMAFRAGRSAAYAAPHGRGLAVAEGSVLEQGRRLMRVMLEQVLLAQPDAGKGGSTPRGVRVPDGRG